MSLNNIEKPWILNIKGAAFIVLGIISLVQIKYSLPILLFILVALLVLNVVVRLGEVFIGKDKTKKTANLVVGGLSLIMVIWFAVSIQNFDFSPQEIDASRQQSFLAILVWLGLMTAASLYEGISLLFNKQNLGYLYFIDGLLLGLMVYLFYLVFNNPIDLSKALTNFGACSLCVGVIDLIFAKIITSKVAKEKALA
jgi:hypothetical protein